MKKITIVVLAFIYGVAIFSQNQSVINSGLGKKQLKTILTEQIQNPDFAPVSSPMNQEFFKSAMDDYGNPPDWTSISQFGGSGAGYGRGIVVDNMGNVYVCGSFSGTIKIGSETWKSVGNNDAFIAKFTDNGTFVWLETLTAIVGENAVAFGINFDQGGNLLITGYHTGSISLRDRVLNSKSEINLFFAKYSIQGVLLMAQNHGNVSYYEIGLVIDTDSDNNIYILGSSDGTVSFRNKTVMLKYDSGGNELWSFYYDQNFRDMKIHGQSINFVGTVSSPGFIGDFYVAPLTYNDAFIAKSNLDLSFEWVKLATHGENTSGDCYAVAFFIDFQGNIVITGNFRNNIFFDGYFLEGYSNFVAKFNSLGDCYWLSGFDTYDASASKDIYCTSNYVVVSSYYKMAVYSLNSGALLDNNDFNGSFYSICGDDEIVFTTGSYDQKIFLSEINTQLNQIWNISINSDAAKSYVINQRSDQFGNLYSFNSTNNTIIFKNIEVNKGLFLTKQNNNGDLIWLKHFPNIVITPSYGGYLSCDTANKYVYITGLFSEPLVIPGQATLIPVEGGSIFLVKYSFNGEFQWAQQFNFDSYGLCLATSNTGGLYLSGTFSGQVNIGNIALISVGEEDMFVARFNSAGTCQWGKRIGGSGSSDYECVIATDRYNNVYFTGEFTTENVTIDSYPLPMYEGDGNIVFAKFSENGTLQWAKPIAGSLIDNGDYNCWPTGIETDLEGSVYMKGWHGDSTFFDNIMLRSPYYDYSKFIAKFDQNGNTQWAKSITETHYGFDYNQMSVDNKGNAYMGLQVNDTLYFENFFMYPCANRYDMVTAKYNTSGALEWAKFIVGTPATSCRMSSVTASGEDHVYSSGYFSNELNFSNTKITAGNNHGFVAAIGSSTGINNPVNYSSQHLFEIFPNPAKDFVQIMINTLETYNISIVDNLGKVLMKEENLTLDILHVNLTSFPSNLCYVIVETKTGTEVRKLVVE